ncbi:trypsin-1-like [Topomyia yanbarensis]|uniref:trypsin-1-like n=1 Tax=Topomyia yanbarensis TaxID=2498891 RepID=UPI00273BBCB2|nr:trypsin-1-like [Topomyia yanbarensis]
MFQKSNVVVGTAVTCLSILLLMMTGAATSPIEVSNSDPRIVGGFPAIANSTSHQVSIRRRTTDQASFGSGHFCGGSLINNRTVLTAAHCLVDSNNLKRAPSYFRVVGGNVNRMQAAGTEIRDISRVVIHEKYNPKNFEHDIGILILTEPIPNTHPTFRSISLTTVTPSAGTICQTSGWGTIKFGQNIATEQLLAVNITVQPLDQCNKPNSYNGSLKPGMFCVGQFEGGRDACQGDSGGPLVCNGVLAGVVSHGVECAKPGYPGIYSDVAYYRQWIERNGASRGSITATWFALALCCILWRYFTANVL